MKNYFLLLVLIGIWSCGPEDETPMQTVNDDFDTTDAILLREGTWMGSGSYNVSGKAEIYENDGKLTLYLDNFSSSSGPDLKVYLSTNTSASSFINLGKLKSTNGMQTYDIPAGTDVANFKFALIWCERFSVLFGKSETQ